MKVTYLCNSDFGKHGNVGFRTFQIAKETYKRGHLNEVIARGNKQVVVPKRHIYTLFWGYRPFNLAMTGLTRIIKSKKFFRFLFFLKLNVFDKFCKKRISPR